MISEALYARYFVRLVLLKTDVFQNYTSRQTFSHTILFFKTQFRYYVSIQDGLFFFIGI